MTFGFIHLKWNKFETSHLFVKSHQIEYHLLFDNHSKYIFECIWFGFDKKLFWNEYKKVLLKSFEYISMFNSKSFYENEYMLYLLFVIIIKMFDSWNCIDVPYWALNSCLFVDNFFSSTLSSDDEWWLGWGIFLC